MVRLTAIAALLVGAVAIATGQWVYLLYVAGVLGAALLWQPSWRKVQLPKAPDLPAEQADRRLHSALRWRRSLMPAWAASVLLMGYALKQLVLTGDGLLAAGLSSVLAFGLTLWLAFIQRQVEALERA